MAVGAVSKAITGGKAALERVAATPVADPPSRTRRTTPTPGTMTERVHLALDVLETPPVGVLTGILGVKALQAVKVFDGAEAYSATLLTAMATTGPRGPLGVGMVAIASAIPALGGALRNVIPSLGAINIPRIVDPVGGTIFPRSQAGGPFDPALPGGGSQPRNPAQRAADYLNPLYWLGWGRSGGIID